MSNRVLGARIRIRIYENPYLPDELEGVIVRLGQMNQGVQLKDGAVLHPWILQVRLIEALSIEDETVGRGEPIDIVLILVWYEEEFNRLVTNGTTTGVACSLFVGEETISIESIDPFKDLHELAKEVDVGISPP